MVTRTPRKFTFAIELNASQGEVLEHRVTFKGGTAVFAILDDVSNQTILSQDDPQPYRAIWPQGAANADTAHGFGCSFVAATKYTWQVAIVKGGNRNVVVDVDYESNVGTDTFGEAVQVFVG